MNRHQVTITFANDKYGQLVITTDSQDSASHTMEEMSFETSVNGMRELHNLGPDWVVVSILAVRLPKEKSNGA
ncbi:MAG: hypothetical protein KAJ19_25520 [Gammaproteobacteria bacterium]|nr:hypothetical protein [Gammaproteobacteria bacterium]